MTFEDDIVLLGQLTAVVAEESPRAGLELSDRLVGLLGNQTAAEPAHKLCELADLLTDFGVHLRNRVDELRS